jgi:hypothetical protein
VVIKMLKPCQNTANTQCLPHSAENIEVGLLRVQPGSKPKKDDGQSLNAACVTFAHHWYISGDFGPDKDEANHRALECAARLVLKAHHKVCIISADNWQAGQSATRLSIFAMLTNPQT